MMTNQIISNLTISVVTSKSKSYKSSPESLEFSWPKLISSTKDFSPIQPQMMPTTHSIKDSESLTIRLKVGIQSIPNLSSLLEHTIFKPLSMLWN